MRQPFPEALSETAKYRHLEIVLPVRVRHLRERAFTCWKFVRMQIDRRPFDERLARLRSGDKNNNTAVALVGNAR